MTDIINRDASTYYERVFECVQDAAEEHRNENPNLSPTAFNYEECAEDYKEEEDDDLPGFLDSGNGVLWYRGDVAIEEGAGSKEKCDNLARTGPYIGVSVLVNAHTEHPWITEYCGTNNVTVYAVDTHKQNCKKDKTCNYHPDTTFHGDSIDRSVMQTPQSLKIERDPQGGLVASSCLSRVYYDKDKKRGMPNVEVQCFKPSSPDWLLEVPGLAVKEGWSNTIEKEQSVRCCCDKPHKTEKKRTSASGRVYTGECFLLTKAELSYGFFKMICPKKQVRFVKNGATRTAQLYHYSNTIDGICKVRR